MPVLPVAHQVHERVAPEPIAVAEREPDRVHSRLGIVAVHVEDRRVLEPRHVCDVARCAPVLGRCGESHLVVLDDVDGAADRIAVKGLEVECLGHHATRGERRIAVQDQRHRGVGVAMRRRNSGIGETADAGGDAGYDAKRNVGGNEGERFHGRRP